MLIFCADKDEKKSPPLAKVETTNIGESKSGRFYSTIADGI